MSFSCSSFSKISFSLNPPYREFAISIGLIPALIPSWNLLYEYYNAFVSRMVSLQDEDQNFDTGTTSDSTF